MENNKLIEFQPSKKFQKFLIKNNLDFSKFSNDMVLALFKSSNNKDHFASFNLRDHNDILKGKIQHCNSIDIIKSSYHRLYINVCYINNVNFVYSITIDEVYENYSFWEMPECYEEVQSIYHPKFNNDKMNIILHDIRFELGLVFSPKLIEEILVRIVAYMSNVEEANFLEMPDYYKKLMMLNS